MLNSFNLLNRAVVNRFIFAAFRLLFKICCDRQRMTGVINDLAYISYIDDWLINSVIKFNVAQPI